MENNTTAILSIAYLGPVQYYAKLFQYKNILIEKHENYNKQTYRNRCYIYGANGKQVLSIPVQKGVTHKTKINDVEIDFSTDWQKNHWKSIESAYRSSPYFDFYYDEIYPFYRSKMRYLFDFNFELQKTILGLIGWHNHSVEHTEHYYTDNTIADFRDAIHPKDSRDSDDNRFMSLKYHQVFIDKYGFIPNLSTIDLLFNEGPNTYEMLKGSIRNGSD